MLTMNLTTTTLTAHSSVQTRQRLTRSFSPLRRVRPRVPFFQLPAHRIPTRWSLYRGLLKCLPSVTVRYRRLYEVIPEEKWESKLHGGAILWWIRRAFRGQRYITSPQTCRRHLVFWHKLLDTLQIAPQDMNKRKLLSRYQGLLAARKERVEMEVLYEKELAWLDRMRNRAIMTGGYLRPSVNNRPLPRFHRQPIHISMMIRRRIKSKIRRLEKQPVLKEWLDDITAEGAFQTTLWEQGVYETENEVESMISYGTGTKSVLETISKSFQLDRERASSIFTPEMINAIKRARRHKIENKTRERRRELRGEITNRLVKRVKQGPPAHVLTKMNDEERWVDRVLREVSPGGYSGRIKEEEKAKRRSLAVSTRAVPGTGGNEN